MSDFIFRLELPAKQRSLAPLLSAVRGAALNLGFSEEAAGHLDLAVEEAASNTIQHAYAPGSQETFFVTARIELGRLVLRVEDRGIPFDPFRAPVFDPANPESRGLGFTLMRRFADELRYVNLGKNGKAFDLVKRLPEHMLKQLRDEAAVNRPAVEQETIPGEQIRIRLFRPEDAAQVARCAYQAYGYSYLGEHLYEPERLIEMNQRGELVSVVAVTEDGRVGGHIAMIFGRARNVAEVGQAFVIPQVRGGGIFKKMKIYLMEIGREMGLEGVFSESVAVHPFTQKGNVSLGGVECGLLLGFVPATLEFKAISSNVDERGSAVLFFITLNSRSEPVRVVFPPHHASFLRTIYERLRRPYVEVEPAGIAPERSEYEIDAIHHWKMGILRVQRAGSDFVEEIGRQKRQLCLQQLECLILDLRFDDAAAMRALPELEMLGFFVAGVIPGIFGEGDALRMMYLNNIAVDAARICLASETSFGHWNYLMQNGAEYAVTGALRFPCEAGKE